ncbi:VHS domain-containing protein [Dorcoceras hygrometricum]|uniref:VHS domain-containing protein n=1 Tax=Dorcoceras hygrometricum TaxID=472368 RepID=A0A2Z7BDV5_9LAMI|nr:VHS domain-containing protein [Dorcoceras hygrometricum]
MQIDSDLVIYRTTLVRTFQVVTICRVDKSEVLVVLISPHDSKPAAAARLRRKIVSGQLDEENPFMLISSVLLVQADEGVSFLVVDRIGDFYRNLPRRADVIVTTVGARHKCQQASLYTMHSKSAGGNHRSMIIGPVSPSQLGGRHSNPVGTTPMIALNFSGMTHLSASHNVDLNQKQQEMLTQNSNQQKNQRTPLKKDTATSHFFSKVDSGLKWVAIERATLKESSGTKIAQIIGGERRQSTEIGHGEQ